MREKLRNAILQQSSRMWHSECPGNRIRYFHTKSELDQFQLFLYRYYADITRAMEQYLITIFDLSLISLWQATNHWRAIRPRLSSSKKPELRSTWKIWTLPNLVDITEYCSNMWLKHWQTSLLRRWRKGSKINTGYCSKVKFLNWLIEWFVN